MESDPKPGIEVPVDHAFAAVLQHATAGQAAAQDLDNLNGVHARLRAQHQSFADSRDRDGDEDLIAGLDRLTRPQRSTEHDVLSQGL